MKQVLIEVICQSVSDCIEAEKAGAKRIELLSALYLGGLTPSPSIVREAKQSVSLPIMAMLRPRPAGYCYDSQEFKRMLTDGKELLEAGADGLVFGCLTSSGVFDKEQNRQLCQLCERYGRQAVCHRACDVSGNLSVVPQLIELGFKRILTSGFAASAIEGIETLTNLVSLYQDQIEIMAGAGITAENAKEIVELTGVQQIHTSCRSWRKDPTTNINPKVPVSYDSRHKEHYEVFDPNKLKGVMEAIN